MRPNVLKDWEKDFDEKFAGYWALHGKDGKPAVKAFICPLLKAQRAEVFEELIELFLKYKNEPMTGNVVILELRAKLEKLK